MSKADKTQLKIVGVAASYFIIRIAVSLIFNI